MTNRVRTDAEIAGRNGYIYPKGRGNHHHVVQYKDWCRHHHEPSIVVSADGRKHVRLELDLSPTGHNLTDGARESLWESMRTLIDDKHLREGTTVMMGSGSYLWIRRIPRPLLDEALVRIRALLEPEGTLVVAPLDGARLVAQARGRVGDWQFIESLPPADYRAELRTETT